MQMDDAQLRAARHGAGPMMVLAGPGSGKTTTMTKRVVNLIWEQKVSPFHILVVTFTKASAKEMKERFFRLCREEEKNRGENYRYQDVTFGTFHGIFYGILKQAYRLNAANILGEEKKYDILKEIVYRLKVEVEDEKEFFEGLVQEISMVKNDRIPIEHYYSANCPDETFRRIYKEYTSKCRSLRLLDFDDMLLYCYDLLVKRKDILLAWQKKFQYVLIDEFQDINKIQYDIIKLLAAPENNLFIVGDDDQSIYGFRGAKPEIMLHFPKDFPNVKTEILACNYRSSKKIVEAAKRVIAGNEKRFKKELFTENEEGSPIHTKVFEMGKDEEVYVKDQIDSYYKAGVPYEEMAVLYRTNAEAGFLIETFMEHGIPFQMRDVLPNLYDHWIAKNMISYMKLAMGERSRREFLQVMNRPNRYISRDALEDAQVSFEGLRWFYEGKEWMCDRVDRMEEDLNILKNMTPYGAINYIRHGIGYDEYLKDYAAYRKMKPDDFYEVLQELMESARPYRTFLEWFIHIEEYTEQLKEQAKKQVQEKSGVTIATLHSSKGLEYDVVFLMDVNEGILPYKKAVTEQAVEEERRLLYVGMTRARKELYILYCNERHEKPLEISSFLLESGLVGKAVT